MEIRLKYINQDSFYGSDYFIKRVGYEEKWDRVKRLGDTYYENELLERSVTEKYGSNLKIGKVDNTAAAIGATGSGKLSIDEYVGYNLENVDKLKTAGASVGVSTSGLTSIGVNYSDKKQEGITKNTVIGNVEIAKSSGDEINRDLDTMTEITEDRDFKTNINVESQTINYIKNPEKFKEDLQKAKNEIYDIYHAVDSTVNLQGKEDRSISEQVGEVRQAKVIYNLIDSRLQEAKNQEDIAKAFEGASEDLGYKVKVIFTDPSNSPQLIGVDENGNTYIKDGTAYVDKDTGIGYILVNTESPANSTKAGVIGNVEIGKSSGDEINRDLDSMTEITEDRDFKTNINVESQTISYIKNPEKFKEDLQKAKNEIYDIYHAVDSTVNLQGEETRSPIEQVGEVRQAKVIYNLIDSRLQEAENQEDIAKIFEGASEDLGYKVKVIYTDPSKSPQLIGVDKNGNKYIKDGTAYVDEKTGINYILVNTKSPANSTKAGVIGTIAEEQSHIIGKKEGRQKVVPDGSEKGLESLGRPTNDYFKKQYSKNDKAIDLKSDGKDYSNVDFGENVGDKKNEGWDIYTKDIRKEKQPNGKYYTEKEMQDNINNVFGKGKFDIDWKEYEDNEKYRTQSNYYYFQAKYTLKSNKVNEITDDYIIIQNNDKNIKLNIVPPKESLYHNVEFIFKNKTFKISFNNKNKKYTNEDGYEVVLDKNNKIVTDPSNRGTYNMVTYKSIFSKDTYLHAKIDMKLWKKFGTGPDDKSTREIRERLGGSVFGLSVMLFYDILKIESMKNNQNILSKEEINKKLHEIYFSNEKENNGY